MLVQAMFSHDMKESKEGTVDVEGVKPNVFEQMLRFAFVFVFAWHS